MFSFFSLACFKSETEVDPIALAEKSNATDHVRTLSSLISH